MVLYHGSNVVVEKPALLIQNRFLDFGFGFYTTLNKQQAVDFANKVTSKRQTGKPTLNIYETDENTAFRECDLLRFEYANEAWLDYVSQNRQGAYKGKQYDMIFGPVANDDVYRSVTLYMTGLLTKEQTLEALKIKKLYNQLVFATERALQYINFIGSDICG